MNLAVPADRLKGKFVHSVAGLEAAHQSTRVIGGREEVSTETSKELADEFLSNLKTALDQKKVKFDLKLIKRHSQLYRFYIKSKTHFLFIHASQGKEFFEMPSPWQEISQFISPEDMDWAVVLLKESESKGHKNRPVGFLLSRDELKNMKSGIAMNRMGLMKIREKDLSLKHQFMNWSTFFQLLNLSSPALSR